MHIRQNLSSLSQARSGKTKRESNYDRSGGNKDYFTILPGENLIAVDATPPVITIEGNSAIDVPLDGTFTDPGAIAIDNLDGDLTHKM